MAEAGCKAWIYHEAGYEIKAVKTPQTFSEALRLAADKQEQIESLDAQQRIDAPNVEFAMAVRQMNGACSVGDFAKTIGTGRNRLFKQLKDDSVLMAGNLPYQRHIESGCFKVIEQIPYTDSNGNLHPAFTTYITGKGQVWLENKYRDFNWSSKCKN